MNFDCYQEDCCADEMLVVVEIQTHGNASAHTYRLTVQEAEDLKKALDQAIEWAKEDEGKEGAIQ